VRKLTLSLAILLLLLTSISAGRQQAQTAPETLGPLAPAPAPVSAGAGIATAIGLVGAPEDSVFALRGGGTSEFWHYSISQNEWTTLPDTPAPVGDGGGIIEVASFTLCQPGRFFIAALGGGNTRDFWVFNINENRWCEGPDTPDPVGPGGAIAQLQRIGRIYALRGNGTTDFWSFDHSEWRKLASTPGPVNAGGGLVGINYRTRSQRDELFALQGGGSTAVWRYDVDTNTWTHHSDAPAPIGPGGAVASPNVGTAAAGGVLNVLQGGGSQAVWSLDLGANTWTLIDDAPGAVAAGGAVADQTNGCDFAFVGGGSTEFFSTGLRLCKAGARDFSLSFDRPTVTTRGGKKVKVKLNIAREGSFTGVVRFIPPEDAPAGIKVPASVVPVEGDSLSFKIKVRRSAAPGTHSLTFAGMNDAGIRRAATLTLVVQ
jgi:hypothetical protein